MNALNRGLAVAEMAPDPPGDAVRPGSSEDDVDCCEVCATPAWLVE